MIRKIFAMILAMVMAVSTAGCTQKQEDGTAEAVVPTGEITAEKVNVGFATKNGGYYDLFADITVRFNEDGEIEWGLLENPTMLAFKVSDNWPGGVFIYSGEEMSGVLAALKEIAEAADAETKEQLLNIVEQLGYGGPIEGAST